MNRGLKTISHLVALAILAVGLSLALHAAFAAWSSPTQVPPGGNTAGVLMSGQAATVANLTVQGTNAYLTQTANAKMYVDSTKGLQVRLDNDNNDANAEFTLNNGANAEVLKVDESGNLTAKSDYLPTASKHLTTKDYVDTAVAAAGGGDATLANQETIITMLSEVRDDVKAIKNQLSSTPGAPKNLTATASGSTDSITLAWQAPDSAGGTGITKYKIYRGTTSGGETYLAEVTSGTYSYTNTGLGSYNTYYYKVLAVNTGGDGTFSNEVSVTTLKIWSDLACSGYEYVSSEGWARCSYTTTADNAVCDQVCNGNGYKGGERRACSDFRGVSAPTSSCGGYSFYGYDGCGHSGCGNHAIKCRCY